jgi:hypothetical protein
MICLNDSDIRSGLLRTAIGQAVPSPPSHEDWHRWTWLARFQGGVPLLYRLVDTVPTDLSEDDRNEIRELQVAAMCRCVELEHHLIAVSKLLSDHGIRSVVLKGGATAHLDHTEPSWREYGDIDLLIHPDDRKTAIDLIIGEGWEQGYALPVGHERFYHAITFVRDGVELDLHQHISHRALGLLIDTDELMQRSEPFQIAGSELRALHPVDRMIHAAIHAATTRQLGIRKLSSSADVLLLTRRLASRPDEVLDRAEHWRVRSILELGMLSVHDDARLDLPGEWLEPISRPPRQRDRLVDRAYLGPLRRPAMEEVAYLRVMKTWTDRWRYLTGYLRTDEAYRQQQGRSGPLDQVRYVWSKLRPH